MYESPVKIIAQNMQMRLEDNIITAIQKLGIDIDKKELVKALEYDRQQYDKGYADGKHNAQFQWILCNMCKHYEGVHEVPGHAPCAFWGIGAVMWHDACKRAELWRDES